MREHIEKFKEDPENKEELERMVARKNNPEDYYTTTQ
jgi:ribosomal protein S15P/S13E